MEETRTLCSRLADVREQLQVQQNLSIACGIDFEYLSEAIEVSLAAKVINSEEATRLEEINCRANQAKHEDFCVGLLSKWRWEHLGDEARDAAEQLGFLGL